jgi:hypothetical protein
LTALGEHAAAELDYQGIVDPDRANILNIVGTYADYDDADRPAIIAKVNMLLQFKPLTALTNDPAEWTDRSSLVGGQPLWQSDRDPDAWSHDGGLNFWYMSQVGGLYEAVDTP